MPKKYTGHEREKYLVEKITIPNTDEYFYYINCNSFTAVFNSMTDLMKCMDDDRSDRYRSNYIWF